MFKNVKMYKRMLVFLLVECFMFAHMEMNVVAADTNIAPLGSASTSFCSSWESITALNDGYDPASSSDRDHAVYGNWDTAGATQWVQYDFSSNYTISKCDVYWFADGEGIDVPASCTIQYWNGTAWVNVRNPVGLGVAANKYNTTTFTEVTTNKIRLNMTAKTNYWTGILEWKVWGSSATNTAPVVSAGTAKTFTLPSNITLDGTASDDGKPNNILTTTWSLQSGPGTTSIANPSALNTTATVTVAGTYVFKLTASDTSLSSSDTVTMVVNPAGSSGSYVWNYGNVPSATLETWNDNPTLTPININPYGTPSLTIPYGYILMNEGPNGTSQVSAATQTSILQRINGDLKWETQTLGIHMPPWSTGKTGTKYIDYFFTNTGLPSDPGATGDSSWEGSYPMVESDSNGMSDQNRYNITHEFGHVLLNAYGTVQGNNVSWVQESLNNYMILRLAEWRNGATIGQSQQFSFPSGIGYLDATVFDQPYVPIESCGINSSGEATAPSDYMNDSTGFRYNELFPLFVSQRVGLTFYGKVFESATTTEQNLQTMTRLLDKARVQSMVTEYAARLALGDFMEFSNSIQGLASTSMYAATTNQNGWLVPSDNNKLPRYTGRNNIPISVNSGATAVTVDFAPNLLGSNGTTADMRCQIAYRATDGTTVFSSPVSSGETTIQLTKAPKNGVVIAVISNVTMSGYKRVTSYGWDPTEKFGYKIQITGGTAAATNRLYL